MDRIKDTQESNNTQDVENPDGASDVEGSSELAENPIRLPDVGLGDGPSHIVGVGASAGGLEALVQFFTAMPVNTGYAFVVVQHLSPDFKSVMDELLSRHTAMPIHLAEDRIEVRPNEVYLIPPKTEIVMLGGRLLLTAKDPKSLSLPIDVFFRSLAAEASERAIAIVLSGTGSDGSRGIVDVHEAGGLVMVQSEESAKFDGMPRSATNTGIVDFVLAPEDMAVALLKHTHSPLLSDQEGVETGEALSDLNKNYMQIFQRLRETHKVDFTYYKSTTINRRIERRMAVHKCESLGEYVEVLDQQKAEVTALYEDLLIGVTKFFRDPDAFDVVKHNVIPEIISAKADGEQIRVWVPSCSTGQEAYSLAMLFAEALERTEKKLELKIFGTDLDSGSITIAANGVYPRESLDLVDRDLVSKYFRPEGDDLQVESNLRKMIVFAEQNLLKDPPFTKIDMVSCRNFLIYLQPIAQKKVFTMFLFSLNVGGTLFLGPSESLGDLENEFDTVDRHWNIVRKRRDVRIPPMVTLPNYSLGSPEGSPSRPVGPKTENIRRNTPESELYGAYDELLASHIPATLLVDADSNLVHVFGDAGKFLKGVRGRASLNLLNQVEGNLRLALSTALQRITRDREMFTLSNIPIERVGEERFYVDIEVRPLADRRYTAIQFKEHEISKKRTVDENSQDFDLTNETQGRITDLEKELQFSRESLQATIEELETSNEEMQATNEELLASNEELQSTNEELQSVNEELFTVNTEYEKKNQELSQLNNDIDNLLQSTDIGTVFIDSELRIRKYTPAIAETFNLLPMDIGRPFEHITVNIVDEANIVDQVKTVIASHKPIVREVRDREGRWQLMRIYPYITASKSDSGAVLTLVEITQIKKAERELERRTHSLAAVKQDLEEFAYSASHNLQTPLRSVSSFLDLLKKRLGGGDEEVNEYLDYASSGAEKMKEMISGLLLYTRVETRSSPHKLINLSDVIQDSISQQSEALEAVGGTIEASDSDFAFEGDYKQLVGLFEYLIDNSIKFRGSDAPRISIETKLEGEVIEVRMTDNGIGIAPVNINEVTNLFYREHPEGKYEGLGLGLAICKRIALKHAGTLQVQSEYGVGTTIVMTLPTPDSPV